MSINGYVGSGSVVEDLLTNKLTTESTALFGEKKHRTQLHVDFQSFAVKVT